MIQKKRLLYLVTTDAYFISHRLPLAKAAKKAGFEILVAATKTLSDDCITQEGFTFIPLQDLRRTGQNPFQDLRALLEIIRIYKRHKPDVLHHVALKPVLYGSLAAWWTGVPRVINALTGLGYLFISTKWSSRLIRFFVMVFFRVLFNRPKSILILQNKDDYAKFAAFVKLANLALIRGSGVDTTHFCPHPITPAKAGAQGNARDLASGKDLETRNALQVALDSCSGAGMTNKKSGDDNIENESGKVKEREPLKIALVARMLWDKGIGEAVDAIKLLKARNTPVELLLCGNPDPENPRSIDEQTLNAWQDQGLVQWLGHKEDVATLYQSVDIALLPSYREGLPKSLLEAASCGLPIVTSDVPGCREVVVNDENGFLVTLTPKSIADAIQKLTDNPQQRHTMGLKSRELALKEFSVEKICRETVALYE